MFRPNRRTLDLRRGAEGCLPRKTLLTFPKWLYNFYDILATKHLKCISQASVSLVLTTAIVVVLSLRSFAAPQATRTTEQMKSDESRYHPQDAIGTLRVPSGLVRINGNAGQTGSVILNGSTVSTSSSGRAIIDLGALGVITLSENTTATMEMTGGLVQVRTHCSFTEVQVKRGSVEVRSPKVESLTAVKAKKYDGGVEFYSTGGVDVEVDCAGRKSASFRGAGLIGLLALIGVGAAVAVGIAVGKKKK